MKKRTHYTFLYKLLSRQSVIYLEQITVVAGAHGIEPWSTVLETAILTVVLRPYPPHYIIPKAKLHFSSQISYT